MLSFVGAVENVAVPEEIDMLGEPVLKSWVLVPTEKKRLQGLA